MGIDCNTPLVEVPRPVNADEIVAAIVANALSCVGLTGDAATRLAFADLIGPVDEPGAAQHDRVANMGSHASICRALGLPFGKGGISTCSMVCEGIHARMRVDAPTLYRPYMWGTSMSRAVVYMRAMGAWTDSTRQTDLEPRPGPGAYVVIGDRAFGEVEHAFTVVSRPEADVVENVIESVDGGQVAPSGLQAVKLVRRRWVMRNHRLMVVRVDGDPSTAAGRHVVGWGAAELLKFRADWPTMIAPQPSP